MNLEMYLYSFNSGQIRSISGWMSLLLLFSIPSLVLYFCQINLFILLNIELNAIILLNRLSGNILLHCNSEKPC